MKSDNIGQPKMKLVKWFRNVINNSNVAFAKHYGLTHLPSVVARCQTDHNDRFLKKTPKLHSYDASQYSEIHDIVMMTRRFFQVVLHFTKVIQNIVVIIVCFNHFSEIFC